MHLDPAAYERLRGGILAFDAMHTNRVSLPHGLCQMIVHGVSEDCCFIPDLDMI